MRNNKILDFNEGRAGRVAVAFFEQYANHVHFAPDR